MQEIEYKNQKIKVPENWQDLTLGRYEAFFRDKPKTHRERVAFAAKVCGCGAEVLLSWPAQIFNVVVEAIAFVHADNPYAPSPAIEIDGVKFVIPIEERLTLGEYIDADEAQRGETAVLSTVLAITCRPVGEAYDTLKIEERAAMFAALPTSEVMPLLAFFLRCVVQLKRITGAFSKLEQVAALLPPSTAVFRSLGAGIKLSRIWPATRYLILSALLRYRLARLLHFYNTAGISTPPKRRSAI